MYKILVAFEQSDLSILSSKLDENCTLISEVAYETKKGAYVIPKIDFENEKILSQSVRKNLEKLDEVLRTDSLISYANNLYECSVAPIAAYIKTLDETIKAIKKNQEHVEVWFPSYLLISSKSSAYYLAEHETQGKILYSREATYLPYLVEICKKNKVKIKYMQLKIGLSAPGQRIGRVIALQIWIFIQSYIASLKQKKCETRANKKTVDLIAITRTVGQTEVILPFLELSRFDFNLIVSDARMSKGKNKKLIEDISNKTKKINHSVLHFSVSQVFLQNYRALKLMLLKPNSEVKFCDVTINLNQAITEILVLWPELMLYRNEIYKKVNAMNLPRLGVILSTEQKSPHAQADAWVAKKLNLICLHIMQCDQIARPLPNPIAGHFFLADSKKNAELFSLMWECDKSLVQYIGSFKAIGFKVKKTSVNFKNNNKWCFFAAMDDYHNNLEVLKVLRKLMIANNFEFIVKLHPRDNINNYLEFDDFKFISNGDMRKNDLFNTFDYALSFNSAVILDLIYQEKAYIHLRFGKWHSGKVIYSNDKYYGNVNAITDLEFRIRDFHKHNDKFINYRSQFILENEIEENITNIKNNLMILLENNKI